MYDYERGEVEYLDSELTKVELINILGELKKYFSTIRDITDLTFNDYNRCTLKVKKESSKLLENINVLISYGEPEDDYFDLKYLIDTYLSSYENYYRARIQKDIYDETNRKPCSEYDYDKCKDELSHRFVYLKKQVSKQNALYTSCEMCR